MDLLNCNLFCFDFSICALRLSKTAFGLGEAVALFFLSADDNVGTVVGEGEDIFFSDFDDDPNPFTSLCFLVILSRLAFTSSIISRILRSWMRVNPVAAAALFYKVKSWHISIINLMTAYASKFVLYYATAQRGAQRGGGMCEYFSLLLLIYATLLYSHWMICSLCWIMHL